jgi:hypothetical protein
MQSANMRHGEHSLVLLFVFECSQVEENGRKLEEVIKKVWKLWAKPDKELDPATREYRRLREKVNAILRLCVPMQLRSNLDNSHTQCFDGCY